MDSFNKYNEISLKLFAEMTEEESDKPKSAMPEKRAMTFIKEMKGQFRSGEEVDVVKEGSSYNVFKKNVSGGAHPVKMNEKQAEEFFGAKLNEAFSAAGVGQALGSAARKVVGGAKDLAKGAYYGAKGTTERDATVQSLAKQMNAFLKTEGVKQFTDDQVHNFLRTKVLAPLIAKYSGTTKPTAKPEEKPKEAPAAKPVEKPEAKPAERSTKSPAGVNPEGEGFGRTEESCNWLNALSVIQEEKAGGFKPGSPKFVEKNAGKPKKAKKIGAFRGGKVGSGTSAPKE